MTDTGDLGQAQSQLDGDDGNNSIATATNVTLNTWTDGELDLTNAGVDFYKFEGVKGQKVQLKISAHPQDAPVSPQYIDSVVTLYGPDEQQIAQNDFPNWGGNSFRDAELFTVLPANGTYYVRVAQCITVVTGDNRRACESRPALYGTYQLFVGDINPQILVEERPGHSQNHPTEIIYPVQGPIGAKLLAGDFQKENKVETDVFRFTTPHITLGSNRRPRSSLFFLAPGPEASGGTADIDRVTLKNSTGAVVAEVIPGLFITPNEPTLMSAPLEIDETYTLELTHNPGELGNNPFYLAHVSMDQSSRLEHENNNTTPEPLTGETSPTNSALLAYRVEGNLDVAAGDVDLFSINVGPRRIVSAQCGAWTDGSGLRDLTLSLLTSTGDLIPGSVVTDSQEQPANVQVSIPIEHGASVTLKVSGTQQDAVVTGNSYRCIVVTL